MIFYSTTHSRLFWPSVNILIRGYLLGEKYFHTWMFWVLVIPWLSSATLIFIWPFILGMQLLFFPVPNGTPVTPLGPRWFFLYQMCSRNNFPLRIDTENPSTVLLSLPINSVAFVKEEFKKNSDNFWWFFQTTIYSSPLSPSAHGLNRGIQLYT